MLVDSSEPMTISFHDGYAYVSNFMSEDMVKCSVDSSGLLNDCGSINLHVNLLRPSSMVIN
jgi:hypothetical protein